MSARQKAELGEKGYNTVMFRLCVCLCECVGGSRERVHRRPTVQFPLGILGHGADTVPTPCCFKRTKRSTPERHIWGFVKFPLGPDFPEWVMSSLECKEIWQKRTGFGQTLSASPLKSLAPTQDRKSSGLLNNHSNSISSSLPFLRLLDYSSCLRLISKPEKRISEYGGN